MARPAPAQIDQSVDGLRVAFEHRLDGSVRPVDGPARDPLALGGPAQRVAEEDTLHPPMGAHPFAHGHAGTVEPWPRSRRSTPTSPSSTWTRSPTPRTPGCCTAAASRPRPRAPAPRW